jgi:hypothetical protein
MNYWRTRFGSIFDKPKIKSKTTAPARDSAPLTVRYMISLITAMSWFDTDASHLVLFILEGEKVDDYCVNYPTRSRLKHSPQTKWNPRRI